MTAPTVTYLPLRAVSGLHYRDAHGVPFCRALSGRFEPATERAFRFSCRSGPPAPYGRRSFVFEGRTHQVPW